MVKSTPNLKQFQAAQSRGSLAKLLDIDHKQLTYLLYKLNPTSKYTIFSVAKKNGGKREIHSPISEIKSLQRKLAAGLELCLKEIQQKPKLSNNASHGFRQGRSILTNAVEHRNKRYVFNLDLKDFFPALTAKRIRGILIKDKNFSFNKDVATAIAHIACVNDRLPQGGASSPVISNIVAGILDFHLAILAKKYKCKYTRYADDLTFSTNLKEFPSAIAFKNENDIWAVGKQLSGLISKSGFEINAIKTRMQYKNSRQQVTGLVVNKRVSVPKEYRYAVRAYVNALVTTGSFYRKIVIKNDDGAWETTEYPGTVSQLHGMLGFIHSVENIFRTELKKHSYNYPGDPGLDKNQDITGNLAIFRRFLLFTRFYSCAKPLIICEGKTDNVYLSNAIHQSKSLVPSLLSKGDDGNDVLAVQFLKYARRHKKSNKNYLPNFSAVSILGGGSGGGANLANLMRSYHKELRRFKVPPGNFPVIFIVDNDSGSRPVYKFIKDSLKIDVTGSEPFVNLFTNCYMVQVPLHGKKESSIEDLFSPSDTGQLLEGKPFDFTKDGDDEFSWGKAKFAYEYVAQQSKSMDWTGFHQMLLNIEAAISHYASISTTSKN